MGLRSTKQYPHGTNACYRLNGCRCRPCKDAASAYQRDWSQRVAPTTMPAGPARRHVDELRAAGVGLKTIAKAAGVPHGTLSKLVYGTTTRSPSKRVRVDTYERLLAVSPADLAAGAKIPAGATWALIDEMVAHGVPKAAIARKLGQRGPALQLSRNLVTAGNARAVVELHRAWRAREVELARRDCWGNVTVAVPPPAERGRADISDLLDELAEIVEQRNEQPWRAQAACRGRPTRVWFPTGGDTRTLEAALKICGSCFVRDQCRAEMFDQPAGVYGALTPGRRRQLRLEEAV